jgi:dihydrofolate reductase
MGRLIYTAITSLDGYIEDESGKFDWSEPDAAVHTFINDLERSHGTYLYGRRLYDTMAVWETLHTLPDQPPVVLDFARLWQAADKIVYSRTLESVSTARTRLERSFDPDAVRQLKASAEADLSIGGAHLAAEAFKARLVDECRLFVNPIAVGGGTPALPRNVRLSLELLDERRFDSGVVYLRYRVRS